MNSIKRKRDSKFKEICFIEISTNSIPLIYICATLQIIIEKIALNFASQHKPTLRRT
jgi:hypothetical protein